jgi:sodium transport system permease protein
MNNIIFLVFKKELTDIFRDRKTLIIGILIPLIMFPIMFGVIGKSMSSTTKKVEENLKIAIIDEGNSSLGKSIKAQKNVKLQDTNNSEEDVKSGKVLAALEIPKDFDSYIAKESVTKVKIIYDNSSQQSQMAMSMINSFIEVYSKELVAQRLSTRNIDVSLLTPVRIEMQTATKESEGFGKFMLSLMLPLLLVIYSVTGPLAAATDLGAGEKERGTLEPLLTTQASRMSLLWGKFFAITVMGLMTTVASLIGLYVSMLQKDGMFSSTMTGGDGSSSVIAIEPAALLLIGVIAILTTMVFGALELSISIYARSFKEAQTYLSPLTIIAIVPAYATYMLDAKNIDTFYFHIPLANAVCTLKELIAGIYNINHLLITIGWTILYILAALLFARYMFSKEEVIFRT